jgi:D-aminoacyl-tRNA deacylase
MIGLLQRVSHASVSVDNRPIGEIGRGLLVLVGVERGDDEGKARRLLERLLSYRIFADADDKMNLSVSDIDGAMLLVPQFTLAADTNKGTRPSFTSAATPQEAKRLFDYLLQQAKQSPITIQSGQFGADMQIALLNDGPVTFWLKT